MGSVGEEEWKKRCERFEVLNTVAVALGQNLRLTEVLDSAIKEVMGLFDDVSGVEVYLLDDTKKMLFLKAQKGLSPELMGTGTLQEGEELAGHVAETRKPLFVEHLSDDERIDVQLIKREKLSSYGGVPLLSRGKAIGVLGLYTRVPRVFSEEEQGLLSDLGHHIGVSVKNALMYEQAALRARRFITISRAITVTRQLGMLDEVLQDITKVLVQSLGFDQSWIGMVDEDAQVLRGKVGFGAGIKAKEVSFCYSITVGSQNPAVQAVVEQKPVVYQFVEDVQEADFRNWLEKLKVQSFGVVPVLCEERAVGVIGVFYMTNQSFEEEDVKTLVSIAGQAAIAIENARLYEQIKTSEERYRTLFEAAGTSLVILDEKHCFRLVNHAFETLSGYTRDGLIGQRKLTSFLVGKDQTEEESVEGLKMSPQSWEAQFMDKNRVVRQVHITTTHIPGSSDMLVSLIDMTRQRELERQLYRSEELAAIGELSAGIAHEIRNPLVAIITSVGLLRDEPQLSGEGQQLLDVVKEESDHLAAIVDDFLQFARPKKPSFNEENMNKLLKDVIKRYKDLNKKRIKWVECYDKGLPSVSLDRHQIQQVVTNLLLNSLDAMADGGVLTVETRRERSLNENRVRLTITDTGIGIHEKELSKIFQPFYSTKEKGTGVGLAICQRIVNDHRGEILVESEVGKGSSFSVILPVRGMTI